jgi:hypothetical protein
MLQANEVIWKLYCLRLSFPGFKIEDPPWVGMMQGLSMDSRAVGPEAFSSLEIV